MSDKVKADIAWNNFRKAMSNTVSCPSVELKWGKLAAVSTQKKKLLSIQNSKVRF